MASSLHLSPNPFLISPSNITAAQSASGLNFCLTGMPSPIVDSPSPHDPHNLGHTYSIATRPNTESPSPTAVVLQKRFLHRKTIEFDRLDFQVPPLKVTSSSQATAPLTGPVSPQQTDADSDPDSDAPIYSDSDLWNSDNWLRTLILCCI
jgi:hypothetical protein